jgi:DNA-binding CsgD family transcriptional regulator
MKNGHGQSPFVPGWVLPLPDKVWGRMARDLGLTRRETQVIRCVLDNLDIDDIATRCAISPRTVRAHLEHTYRKLGLRHRSDLILLMFAKCIGQGHSQTGLT